MDTPHPICTSLTRTFVANLRKEAKQLKKSRSIKQHEALEIVAKSAGFESWAAVANAEQEALRLATALPVPEVPEELKDEQLEERSTDISRDAKLNVSKNRELFAQLGIDYAIFEPTATGLAKSILDATQPVRQLFEQQGLHSYAPQGRGPEYKVTKQAFLVSEAGIQASTASLYRPKTKDGDPRMWFSGLREFAEPGEQLAIIVHKNCPHLIVISRALLTPPGNKHGQVQDFLEQCSQRISDTASELLSKLRELAKSPIPATTHGPTAVGMAIEAALNITANSSKHPDYKGIELKSGRGANVRTTLFAQVADWILSKCKGSSDILDSYGYERNGALRLNCTVRIDRPNTQGLMFEYDEKNDLLHEVDASGQNVATWPGNLLRGRLKEKHGETFWIDAESIVDPVTGKESFLLKSVTHTRKPLLNQLMPLIASGVVTMDHLIKRKDGRTSERGPLFKIDKSNLKLLFPEPKVYKL